MPLPDNGWLPKPLNGPITLFTLPEVFEVYYYVCNPGPYIDPKWYELPLITFITINQEPFGDAGYKNGAWGWVAGINWRYAYGDALIDSVYPPTPPAPNDESCPGNDQNVDETCPSDFIVQLESVTKEVIIGDTRVAPVVTQESLNKLIVNRDTRVTPILTADDNPA